MMTKHYVVFYSPGTFVSEQSQKEIDTWDINAAREMARSIQERHGATPYGFQFITRGRYDDELDSREIDRSSMYYLGGKVETIEEVFARNDPKEEILRENMKINGYNRIIVNTNSWKSTFPLNDSDVVLDYP